MQRKTLTNATWTKSGRTKALAALFKQAGFARDGADWVLDRGDLRWTTFLSVVRSPQGDIHDVVSALYRVDPSTPTATPELVAQFALEDLAGTDAAKTYSPTVISAEDPLIRDARDVLLPLVSEVVTVRDVVRALVDLRIVQIGSNRKFPPVDLARAWSLATDLGYPAEAERAERLIAASDWDRNSREVYESIPSDAKPSTPLVPPARRSWRERFQGRR